MTAGKRRVTRSGAQRSGSLPADALVAGTHSRRKLIIAIDGPAGSGKSTTARALAMRLKLPYIDTGAMYRALTLEAMRRQIPFEKIPELVKLAKKIQISFGPMRVMKQKVYLNGKDVTKAIRTPELTRNVMFVAREPRLRREMVAKQRLLGKSGGAVMEGRDIGTVVFPKADYKFFFDASPQVRARRRYRELLAEGKKPSLARVAREIEIRDRSDRERKEGALRVARDARVLDTSGLTIEATVDRILDILAEAS